MLASLAVEAIGWDQRHLRQFGVPMRWFCAEITGTDRRYGLQRRFLQPRADYATSNSVGSRGVMLYYTLERGHLYEVKAPRTWQCSRRYFCTVDAAGDILELAESEAMAMLGRRIVEVGDAGAA